MTAAPTNGSMSPDVLAALADSRIASLHASGALVLAMREAPPRPVFASATLAATFGARDLGQLDAAMLRGGQPGGERLTSLARTLAPDRPARLERLRFFFGSRSSEVFDFECRKVTTLDGPLFVAVAVRRRMHPRRASFADLFEAATPPPVPAPRDDQPAHVDLDIRLAGRRTVRFLWETDADNLTTRVSPEFGSVFGDDDGLVVGASFPQTARALAADPDGRLEQALGRRETFSHLQLAWPLRGLNAVVPIVLAGQPRLDGQRGLLGHRGFGVIRVDRLIDAPALVAARAIAETAPVDGPAAALVDATPARAMPAPAHGGDVLGTSHTSSESPMSATNHASDALAPEPHDDAHAWDNGHSAFDHATPLGDGEHGSAHDQGTLARPALTVGETDAFDELASLLQARLAGDESGELPEEAAGSGRDAPDQGGRPAAALPVPDDAVAAASAAADKDVAAAMERLPIGVLVTRGGVGLYANKTLLDLLGHADIEAFRRAGGLDYTLRGRDPGSFGDEDGGISVATAAGEILNVDGHLQAMNWGGEPATLMSFRRSAEAEIARRIAALRQELTAQETETSELHAILDTATDGVAVLDRSGIVLSLNRSAEALFGLEQGDVVGEPLMNLLAPESHATARDYLAGLRKNGVASVLNDGREVVGRAGGRGIIPLFMTIGHLPQRDETRFCAVLRDLTPWKRAERDLKEARRTAERASQMKSDFLARISHEIRTPMNAILGFAEVIVEERFGTLGNDRYKEYLHDIHASGVHVMNIVNDLLDLSKIEAGKMEMMFASVDANKVVADCVSLMQPQAHRERVIIRMALAPRLPNVVADERSLRQIVLNILSNAVNFNEAGGQVIVSSALTDSGTAVLRIRDTGIGMSESDLEAALEPFRKLSSARKGTGTGLGLPLTKALADANRALFTIKSKKDEGTLVEIAFPPARVLTG